MMTGNLFLFSTFKTAVFRNVPYMIFLASCAFNMSLLCTTISKVSEYRMFVQQIIVHQPEV